MKEINNLSLLHVQEVMNAGKLSPHAQDIQGSRRRSSISMAMTEWAKRSYAEEEEEDEIESSSSKGELPEELLEKIEGVVGTELSEDDLASHVRELFKKHFC